MRTQLFDPLAAWKRLAPEQQQGIGVAAIVHMLGANGALDADVDSPFDGRHRVGWDAANVEGFAALDQAVRESLPAAFSPEPLRPDLAAIGVRACRVCGCTDECGCPEGCSWIGPDLCSSCQTATPIGADPSWASVDADAETSASSTEVSAPPSRTAKA